MVDEEDADATAAARASDYVSGDASTFLKVLSRLRHALGDARGKLRVTDAQLLADLDLKSHYDKRLIARALRHLGWKRARYRFDGAHAYAYAKGTRLQRETILEVSNSDEGKLVVKRRDP